MLARNLTLLFLISGCSGSNDFLCLGEEADPEPEFLPIVCSFGTVNEVGQCPPAPTETLPADSLPSINLELIPEPPKPLVLSPVPELLEATEEAAEHLRNAYGLPVEVMPGGIPIELKVMHNFHGWARGDGKCIWDECNTVARILIHPNRLETEWLFPDVKHEIYHVASAWGREYGSDHLEPSRLMDPGASGPETAEDAELLCSAAPCSRMPSTF